MIMNGAPLLFPPLLLLLVADRGKARRKDVARMLFITLLGA